MITIKQFTFTLESMPLALNNQCEFSSLNPNDKFYIYENGIYTLCVVKNDYNFFNNGYYAEDLNSGKTLELYPNHFCYTDLKTIRLNHLKRYSNNGTFVRVWINTISIKCKIIRLTNGQFHILCENVSGDFRIENVVELSDYLSIPEITIKL